MYEKIKQFLYDFRIAIFAFVVCFGFSWYCYCNRTTDGSTVDGTIHDIKQSLTGAGSDITAAQEQISNAEASIERASGAIRQSRDRAAELQAGLDECEELIDRCLEQNRTAQSILREARESNRAGTQESKAN